jgi:hypothetical protein
VYAYPYMYDTDSLAETCNNITLIDPFGPRLVHVWPPIGYHIQCEALRHKGLRVECARMCARWPLAENRHERLGMSARVHGGMRGSSTVEFDPSHFWVILKRPLKAHARTTSGHYRST